MIKRLNTKNLENAIADPNFYSCVLFSSKNCPPCEDLKKTIAEIYPTYKSQIKFYTFDKNQLAAKDLLAKYRVNFTPRMVIFKNDKEVGRFLWANYPTEHFTECMKKLLSELLDKGSILTRRSDVDEIVLFRNRLMECMDWDNYIKDKKDMVHEANRLQDISDHIIKYNPFWAHLNKEQLTDALDDCLQILEEDILEVESSKKKEKK